MLKIVPVGHNQSHAVGCSSLALVREHLRRVAEWAALSGSIPELGPQDALRLDLAGWLLPELVPAPDLVAGLAGLQFNGSIAVQVAANYVRWEAAAGHAALIESGLWEPYEPLIRLFERGGELFTHHGFIHVEHCTCFMPGELRSFADLSPLLDLHPRTLDKLDRAEQ